MAVEDFLKSGPLSLTQVIEAIRTQSLDTNAHPIFSDTEIKLAIREAVIASHGKYFTTNYTTVSFTNGSFGPYSLSNDVHRITMILRERTGWEVPGNILSSTSPDARISEYRHFRRRGANELYFTKDYRDSTLTVWYETDVAVPIEDRTTSGSHNASVTTMTLIDADPQLYGLELSAYFLWDDEIVKVTAVSGNTSATIVRAQLGTTASTHTDGSTISQLIMSDNERFYNFLFQEAGRLLNEWRVQAGNQNVSVAANITASRMFKENRDGTLKEIPQSPRRTRRMSFSRTRRPRRNW